MTVDTMTEPLALARKRNRTAGERTLLVFILVMAAAIRIRGIAFGLPDLNDPDEPVFMMTAMDMLRNGTLNPGWFGHPGTITFYSICLVTMAVAGTGIATGRYADVGAFVAAAYADPAVLMVPVRLFFAACGVACIFATYLIGKRLAGPRTGLIAASLLALSPVHVEYSQLVRTDVQMSLFMLLCTLASIAIVRSGLTRHHALAGLCVALGIATKWPAAIVALNALTAALTNRRRRKGVASSIVLFGLCSVGGLLLASPYLLLDFSTVARNLAGEARPMHPGATGGGLAANFLWYARGPLANAFGTVGLALAALGTIIMPLRYRTATVAILPAFLALALVLFAQALTWERWVVPLLPFLALAAASALCFLADLLRRLLGRPLRAIEAGALAFLLVPVAGTTLAEQTERMNDTRQVAAAWVQQHVPHGKTILVEHAAFGLLGKEWKLRFPLGTAGCIDAMAAIAGQIPHAAVEARRAGPAVDIGYVPAARLASCGADYAIFSRYQLYRDEGPAFAPQRAAYEAIAAGGDLQARLIPEPGRRGGPEVEIWKLRRPPIDNQSS